MGRATTQRIAFSDALLEVGPDAPTLCEGWTAYDLAAHCWVRERSPKALLGIGVPPLEHLATDAMERTKERMGFVELATKLRETPTTPITVVPGADDTVNLAEFLIHTEDVRRANGLPLRPIDDGIQVAVWRKLPLIGRVFFAKAPVGVVLEAADSDAAPARVKAGAHTVTLVGRPAELLLFAFGREQHAEVRPIGRPGDVRRLLAAPRGA